VILVASNSIVYQTPRIHKIVTSLRKRYKITVLGWDREGIPKEIADNYHVHVDLFRLRAPYGRLRLVPLLPLFWIWIYFKLIQYRPTVVHACDLDALIPCYMYKKLFKKKVVFDVFDRYFGYVPANIRGLAKLVKSFEDFMSMKSDLLITVSEKVLNTFNKRPKQHLIIANYPQDFPNLKKRIEDNVLTLIYAGDIRRDLGLEIITDIIKDIDRVELMVVGKILDKSLLAQIQMFQNVKYKGVLEHRDALDLEASSDAMVVLYGPKFAPNLLSSPNKIFEAMMCGHPVITNMEAEVVEEVCSGIIVDYNNTCQIREAIVSLRDNPALIKELGENGRRSFLEKYNWNRMEDKLLSVYDSLLGLKH
jgi:glycosyltransferase involved in cell wall biosynthesis